MPKRAGGVIEVGLLGAIVLKNGPRVIRLSAPLEQALVARLALDPGRAFAPSRLVSDLWGEYPPRNEVSSLQNLVYRVRRALGPDHSRLRFDGGLYSLDLAPEQVDAGRFERLVQRARSLQPPDPSIARLLLGEAISLFRGPPLAGLEAIPFVPAQATRLEEARLAAMEERVDADLTAGRHVEIVAELEALVGEHPMRERLWAQLMLAHYRSGGQASALRTYQRLQRQLGEELGIQPSAELVAMEEAIILQKPHLDWHPSASESSGSARGIGDARIDDPLHAPAARTSAPPGAAENRCPSCGSENPDDKRFCGDCGAPLATACSRCGGALVIGKRFCADCGAPVPMKAGPPASVRSSAVRQAARRHLTRLCSVLFCELHGFGALPETGDPEEAREILAGYYELSRAIVDKYGGVVESLLGLGMTAVWGSAAANGGSEHAVRAGLELVAAVAAWGSERSTVLAAKAGIVTGDVECTDGEPIVADDLVSAAATIQSVGPAGFCYVDEATRNATSASITYIAAGEFLLTGAVSPAHLYRAVRVVAAAGGSQRPGGLEAPFVGRDHDLRLLKDLYHATADRRSGRFVLITGVAGVGKSRLAWELLKYLDGLADPVVWHAGRCVPHGEGVSYSALSEMARGRLSIGEDDPIEIVAERLRTGLDELIADRSDRDFIAPRLGQLLGIQSGQERSREDLFAGWRLFFECLSDREPVVLFVEDLQWADVGVVAFLDHLVEWSGDHAIFVLALSRPDGPHLAGLASSRATTTLTLDPLPDELMGELLDGLVTKLPAVARSRIVARAEGIPLYAIETVRSLMDKGVVARRQGGQLELTGALEDFEIPPGLAAVVARRLDDLSRDELRVLRECSVLGASFSRPAVDAVSSANPGLLDGLLASLVQKEMFRMRAEKHSPAKNEYAFTQSLIRSVAYEGLTRPKRKACHLRAAAYLRSAFPEAGGKVAELIAAHLYDAYTAAGEDADREPLREQAKESCRLAGERAEAVGSLEAAESAFLLAAELSADEREQTRFTGLAGKLASQAGWHERSAAHLEKAIMAHKTAGRDVDAARLVPSLAESLMRQGKHRDSLARLQVALASLKAASAPPDILADVEIALGRHLMLVGRQQDAGQLLEDALTLAEHHELKEQLVPALVSSGLLLHLRGRPEEAIALLEAALAIRPSSDDPGIEGDIQANLASIYLMQDRPGAEEHARAGLASARRAGLRHLQAWAGSTLICFLAISGRLAEAKELGAELLRTGGAGSPGADEIHFGLVAVEAARGDAEAAREHLTGCRAWNEWDAPEQRARYSAAEASVFLVEGNCRQALESGRRAIEIAVEVGLGVGCESTRAAFPVAVVAAIELGDVEEGESFIKLLASHPRGEVPPFLRAQLTRAQGLIAGARGEGDDAVASLIAAETALYDLAYPYWAALTKLERAEWLAKQQQLVEAAALAHQAATSFQAVGASTMIDRSRRLFSSADVAASGVAS